MAENSLVSAKNGNYSTIGYKRIRATQTKACSRCLFCVEGLPLFAYYIFNAIKGIESAQVGECFPSRCKVLISGIRLGAGFDPLMKTMLQRLTKIVILICCATFSLFAQGTVVEISQEMSDEGIPVLTKHLPDWENAQYRSVYIRNSTELKNAIGDSPVVTIIDFAGGTEAVFASYDSGKLLLVEFNSPQDSIETDNKSKESLSNANLTAPIFFRRIGNYNAFVFDAPNEAAANVLLDQIKYQKMVQWLGEDPFMLQRAERRFIEGTSEVFFTIFISVVVGLSFALIIGLLTGMLVFYSRNKKRAAMTAFSDAGGMIRLNLDELTPQVSADNLLGD